MKKINKITLPFLAISVIFSSCTTPVKTEQDILRDILINVEKPNTLPKITRGIVTGSIIDKGKVSVGEKPEYLIKVIRNEDIYEVDSNGKRIIGTDKKEKLIERKGQVIQVIKVKDSLQFKTDDLLPGAISLLSTRKQENIQIESVIEAGKITELKPIIFGDTSSNIDRPLPITSILISGKVVNPDGSPVVGAKVSDVTNGFTNTSTITDSNGTFSLNEPPFTTPRNLEVSFGNIETPEGKFASYSVKPDVVENIVIPLLSNSRFISGRLFNSVLKTNNIANMPVKIEGTNISTTTDAEGNFKLKGVPLSQATLSIGGLKGFVPQSIALPPVQTSEDRKIGDVFVVPLGNILINLIAESSIIYDVKDILDPKDNNVYSTLIGSPNNGRLSYEARAISVNGILNFECSLYTTLPELTDHAMDYRKLFGYTKVSSDDTDVTCEYVNTKSFSKDLNGIVQFEGTDIKIPFTYPKTPVRTVTKVAGVNKKTIELDSQNLRYSIPINDIPGGEYTVSVSLEHHETQKGLRIVVPSNDVISTELLQMRLAKSLISIGDVEGKVILKDKNGNIQSIPPNTKVAAISSTNDVLDRSKVLQVLTDPLANSNLPVRDQQLAYSIANVSSDGTYILKDVLSGTRAIVVGVVTNGVLDESYLANTYVLVNVVSGVNNKAPDMIMYKR
ncbi:MAG: carboxypeptidase regulatory-like domain-containing protein [Candidatus Sericytochromatia bacterium]